MKIAILGYGTVGSGVYEIISNAHTSFTKSLLIKHILVRPNKNKTVACMCDDFNTIINDDDCDVVVEALGGIEPAHTYILSSLMHKKHVVTANKAVVAKHLSEFHECAKKHNVTFSYEASTGGGVPWVEGLKKAMRIDQVDLIYGIFNGTSNFILDHMQRFGSQFDQTLLEAQKIGYAESDPSADIDGYDICNKIIISASLAYNYHVPANFPVFGIRNIIKDDVDYFRSINKVVRLIAMSKREGNRYICVVEPVLYNLDTLEANTKDNYNLMSLHGQSIQDLKFYGQGAGKLATANAIVQDIIDIPFKKSGIQVLDHKMTFDPTICSNDYILRSDKNIDDLISECHFTKQHFANHTYYLIRKIEVSLMHNYMKKILSSDPMSFMASIHEEE